MDEATQYATLMASLKEAEKAVEFERAEALRLQNEVSILELARASTRDEKTISQEETRRFAARVKSFESAAADAREENSSLTAQLHVLQGRIDELENHTINLENEGSICKSVEQRLLEQVQHLQTQMKEESDIGKSEHERLGDQMLRLREDVEFATLANTTTVENVCVCGE